MTRIAVAIAFCSLAAAAKADPMTAAEFEAYVTGKTLHFGRAGQTYGAEIYRDNRRVTWSFLDGECQDGYWYEDGENICFLYENRDEPQCWTFELRSGGLNARFANDSDGLGIYEAQDTGEEMVCLGPKVGV